MRVGCSRSSRTRCPLGKQMADSTPVLRTSYRFFVPLTTRWMDNDVYGHVNNVVYYAYFDTVVNSFLIAEGGLNIETGPVIGLCVESQYKYVLPVAFPDSLEAGLRVAHVGKSSVRYDVGVFRLGMSTAAAHGHFVHVFVDRVTR